MQKGLRSLSAVFLLGVLYVAGLGLLVGTSLSADLRALWLAGQFYPQGDPALVYRMSGPLFTMEPPAAWMAATLAEGREVPVYPFIYPPLWAALMAEMAAHLSYETFAGVMSVLNRLLLPAMFVLAWRIARPAIGLTAFLAIALLPTFFTLAFLLPVEENQPQILVSFLLLLAVERQRAGSPVAGGAALALAAAIKLYPAIFALLWLAAGERRATLAFAVAGGALGAASVAIAGWEMHAAFLGELRAISDSVLLSLANFSVSPLAAALFVPLEQTMRVTTELTGGTSVWYVLPKTGQWRLAEAALQAATLAGLLLLAYRSRMREPLLWPAALIAVAWVSPLSWVYHYMTALAFLPALAGRMGVARTLLLIAVCLAPTSFVYAHASVALRIPPETTVLLANAGLLALGVVFLRLALSPRDAVPGPAAAAAE
jgi:hypothetical protein